MRSPHRVSNKQVLEHAAKSKITDVIVLGTARSKPYFASAGPLKAEAGELQIIEAQLAHALTVVQGKILDRGGKPLVTSVRVRK